MNGKRVKKLRQQFKTFIAMEDIERRSDREPKKATWLDGLQQTKDEFRLYKRLWKQNVNS